MFELRAPSLLIRPTARALAARIGGADPAAADALDRIGLEAAARADVDSAWPSARSAGAIASSAGAALDDRPCRPGANSTGSAIASCALSFQSSTPIIALATWAMIVAPPAAPIASRTLPSGP